MNTITNHELLKRVFPTTNDYIAGQHLAARLFDQVTYEELEPIISVTYRIENYLTISLGQWMILRFDGSGESLKLVLNVDWDLLSNNTQNQVERFWRFEPKWAADRNFVLVRMDWDSQTNLPTDLLESWQSAIAHCAQTFKKRKNDSYHHHELAHQLLNIS